MRQISFRLFSISLFLFGLTLSFFASAVTKCEKFIASSSIFSFYSDRTDRSVVSCYVPHGAFFSRNDFIRISIGDIKSLHVRVHGVSDRFWELVPHRTTPSSVVVLLEDNENRVFPVALIFKQD